jgi:hypothetical protein
VISVFEICHRYAREPGCRSSLKHRPRVLAEKGYRLPNAINTLGFSACPRASNVALVPLKKLFAIPSGHAGFSFRLYASEGYDVQSREHRQNPGKCLAVFACSCSAHRSGTSALAGLLSRAPTCRNPSCRLPGTIAGLLGIPVADEFSRKAACCGRELLERFSGFRPRLVENAGCKQFRDRVEGN